MVRKINEQEFQSEAMTADVAVVDFSATWCGPCRMLAPVLEDVSEEFEGKVSFFNVDVDECMALAEKYHVMSVPCVIMLKKGEMAAQTIGFQPQSAISAWVSANL